MNDRDFKDAFCQDVGDRNKFVCSRCGCKLYLMDNDSIESSPTLWHNGQAIIPSFCPNCGKEIWY